jgi:predicted CoA-binding protein
MAKPSVSLETINDFLAQKRIAMVGISRNPRDFSMMLFKELVKRGYDVIPVNPRMAEVEGRRCFARLQQIQPAVDGALLMTSPGVTETVVKDCAEAGIKRVWMYRAGGTGAVSMQAIAFCQEHGIQVVPGECPYMFLPHAGLHRVHGFIRRISRSYPRHAAA